MANKPQFSSSKVSNIAGKLPSKKMDGYAAGKVPESMQGNKKGWPYSGPNVTRATRG